MRLFLLCSEFLVFSIYPILQITTQSAYIQSPGSFPVLDALCTVDAKHMVRISEVIVFQKTMPTLNLINKSIMFYKASLCFMLK